jgi:hypothetical protein
MRPRSSSSLLRVDCTLSDNAVSALIRYALEKSLYQKPCADWQWRRHEIGRDIEKQRLEGYTAVTNDLKTREDTLGKQVMVYLIERILDTYP